MTALVGALKTLTGMGKGIVDMASHFETVRTELGTVLQDAEKGAKLFEDLRKFSFDTTFGVDELADASKQLLNAGESVSSLNGELKMLGDLAGGSKQKFAELTSIYSKVLTTGRATSIQLQQFNLRGIPITKTLKEMGVTGVASAEQLQEAFKKLTEEGGQFHDSMNNIIDTIEGKRGFITDTIKEIQVNLGEVTGLTDLYKNSLDVIYEVLNGFNNLLMKINDNPFLKALVSGVVTTLVVGLVTIIGGSLVTALGTVATKLGIIAGLKAVISSPVGWIALGVAGIAGIAGAIAEVVSYTKSQKDLEVQAIKTQKALKGIVPEVKKENTYEQNKSYAESMIQILNDNIKQYQEELETARKEMESWQTEWNVGGEDNAKEVFGITELENKIDSATKSLKKWNDELKQYNALEQAGKEIQDLGTEFDRIFGDTDIGKKQQEINAIVKDIQTLKTYLGKDGTVINGSVFKFTDDTKQQINDTIKYLEEKLDELYGKEKKKNWWEIFEDVTGIKGEKNSKGSYSGKYQGETYRASMMNSYWNLVSKGKVLGMGENYGKDVARDFVNQIQNDIESLLSTGEFNVWDNSIKEMLSTIDYFNLILEEDTKNIDNSSQSWIESMGGIGSMLFNTATSMSKDFSNAIQGFTQGGVWGAVINVILSAFQEVAKECDKFDKAMNPITSAFYHLKKYIADGIDVLAEMSEGVESVVIVFAELLEILRPTMQVVTIITKLANILVKSISLAFKELFTAIGKLFKNSEITTALDNFIKSLDDTTNSLDEQLGLYDDELLDSTKDLTNEYKALLDAMKDYEEWYIERKTGLNAEAYKYSYDKVNDMILTPNGNFSTHPDDYIIATKNPNSLGGSVNNVTVQNNYAGSAEVQIQEQPNSMGGKDMMVVISRKIAQDVANGSNGWDNALDQRQYRMAGRRVRI